MAEPWCCLCVWPRQCLTVVAASVPKPALLASMAFIASRGALALSRVLDQACESAYTAYNDAYQAAWMAHAADVHAFNRITTACAKLPQDRPHQQDTPPTW